MGARCLVPKVYLQQKYTVGARCLVPKVYLQQKYTVCARVSYLRCTCNGNVRCVSVSSTKCVFPMKIYRFVHVSPTKGVLPTETYCFVHCLVLKMYFQRKYTVSCMRLVLKMYLQPSPIRFHVWGLTPMMSNSYIHVCNCV